MDSYKTLAAFYKSENPDLANEDDRMVAEFALQDSQGQFKREEFDWNDGPAYQPASPAPAVVRQANVSRDSQTLTGDQPFESGAIIDQAPAVSRFQNVATPSRTDTVARSGAGQDSGRIADFVPPMPAAPEEPVPEKTGILTPLKGLATGITEKVGSFVRGQAYPDELSGAMPMEPYDVGINPGARIDYSGVDEGVRRNKILNTPDEKLSPEDAKKKKEIVAEREKDAKQLDAIASKIEGVWPKQWAREVQTATEGPLVSWDFPKMATTWSTLFAQNLPQLASNAMTPLVAAGELVTEERGRFIDQATSLGIPGELAARYANTYSGPAGLSEYIDNVIQLMPGKKKNPVVKLASGVKDNLAKKVAKEFGILTFEGGQETFQQGYQNYLLGKALKEAGVTEEQLVDPSGSWFSKLTQEQVPGKVGPILDSQAFIAGFGIAGLTRGAMRGGRAVIDAAGKKQVSTKPPATTPDQGASPPAQGQPQPPTPGIAPKAAPAQGQPISDVPSVQTERATPSEAVASPAPNEVKSAPVLPQQDQNAPPFAPSQGKSLESLDMTADEFMAMSEPVKAELLPKLDQASRDAVAPKETQPPIQAAKPEEVRDAVQGKEEAQAVIEGAPAQPKQEPSQNDVRGYGVAKQLGNVEYRGVQQVVSDEGNVEDQLMFQALTDQGKQGTSFTVALNSTPGQVAKARLSAIKRTTPGAQVETAYATTRTEPQTQAAPADQAPVIGPAEFAKLAPEQQAQEYAKIHKVAMTDTLTDLSNRRGLTEQTRAAGKPLGEHDAIILDIDDFKNVNTKYGHPVGDEVIATLAQIINDEFRGEAVGRWGGEEFAILPLTNKPINDILDKVEDARAKFSAMAFAGGKLTGMTFSAGHGVKSGEKNSIAVADEALYEAKNAGKAQTFTKGKRYVRTQGAQRAVRSDTGVRGGGQAQGGVARDIFAGQPVVQPTPGPRAPETVRAEPSAKNQEDIVRSYESEARTLHDERERITFATTLRNTVIKDAVQYVYETQGREAAGKWELKTKKLDWEVQSDPVLKTEKFQRYFVRIAEAWNIADRSGDVDVSPPQAFDKSPSGWAGNDVVPILQEGLPAQKYREWEADWKRRFKKNEEMVGEAYGEMEKDIDAANSFYGEDGEPRFQRQVEQSDLFAAPKPLSQIESEEKQRIERGEVKNRIEKRRGGQADFTNLPMFENQDIEGSQQTLFQRQGRRVTPKSLVGAKTREDIQAQTGQLFGGITEDRYSELDDGAEFKDQQEQAYYDLANDYKADIEYAANNRDIKEVQALVEKVGNKFKVLSRPGRKTGGTPAGIRPKRSVYGGRGNRGVVSEAGTELVMAQEEVRFQKEGQNEPTTVRQQRDAQVPAPAQRPLQAQGRATGDAQHPNMPAVVALQRAVEKAVGETIPANGFAAVDRPAGEEHLAAQGLADELGVEIVWFKQSPDAQAVINLGGVQLSNEPTTIYVNETTKKPVVVTVVHETMHIMQIQHPDLYREVRRAYIEEGTQGFRQKRDGMVSAGYSTAESVDESVAEISGEMFTDPGFLRRLAQRSPDAFRQLVDTMLEVIAKAKAWLKGQKIEHAGKYFRDLNRVEAALQKAIIEMKKRATGERRMAAQRQGAAFQAQPEDKNLIALHNLSAENIIHADKMGGIAMPSLAVNKKGNALDSFGDISLIANRDFIDPKLNSAAKTFDADIYSPRYPEMRRDVNRKKFVEKYDAIVKKYLAETKDKSRDRERIAEREANGWPYANSVYDQGDDIQKTLNVEIPMMKAFLDEKGIPYKNDSESIYGTVRHSKNMGAYDQYVSDFMDTVTDKKRIFKGYTYSGNKRWAEYTLPNILAEMNKALRGGEGFQYGAGNVRAAVAKKFTSIEQMKKDEGRIVSNEEFESQKKAFQDRLGEIAHRIAATRPGINHFTNADSVVEGITEGIKRGAIRKELESYGFSVTETDMDDIRAFLKDIKAAPTEYFETKIRGAVSLRDFSGAVIPKTSDRAVRDVLDKNGIPYIEYDKTRVDDRVEKIKKFGEEKGLFFQKQNADPFYSPTVRAVEALKQERGTGDQFFAQITKTPGVKEAEWKWMGLDDFLKGKQSVTKAEIAEFVRQNQARVEEVEKRGPGFEGRSARQQILIDRENAGTITEGEVAELDVLEQEVSRGEEGIDESKYSQYQLPGGENYREVLPVFDRLFETIKTRETPTGVAMFQRQSPMGQTKTPEFKTWFGDWENDPEKASKVVDESGKPLVVYHGMPLENYRTKTPKDFTVFDRDRLGDETYSNASDKGYAATSLVGFWHNSEPMVGKPNTPYDTEMKNFLAIKNPIKYVDLEQLALELDGVIGHRQTRESARRKVKQWVNEKTEEGYDGIMINDEEFGGISYAPFSPTQIKSATGNSGAFNPANPDIRFQRQGETKKRSFPQSLDLAGRPATTDENYEVKTNEQTVERANEIIKDKGVDGAEAWVLGETNPSAEHTATAISLISKLQSEAQAAADKGEPDVVGKISRAINIATDISRKLTAMGQAVQAASIVSRLSPDGVVLYATKKIEDYNRQHPKDKPEKLELEQAQNLIQLAQKTRRAEIFEDEARQISAIVERLRAGETLAADEKLRISGYAKSLSALLGEAPISEGKPTKEKRDGLAKVLAQKLDTAEAAARLRFEARHKGTRFGAGLPIDDMADLSIIGAAKIGKLGLKYADWYGQMVADFGAGIKPHLKAIWGRSIDAFNIEKSRAKKIYRESRAIQGLIKKVESDPDIAGSRVAAELGAMVDKIQGLTGDAKIDAAHELQAALAGLEKPTALRKIATAQTIAQLLNPKTILVRNPLGNEMFYRLERFNKTFVATPIDILVSKMTGNRTLTFKTANQGGFWKAWMTGARAGWNGWEPEGLQSQFDLKGAAFRGKLNPMTYLEKSLGASIRSFDFAAYTRAKNQVIGEMAELAAANKGITGSARKAYISNFIRNVDEFTTEVAQQYGKYATFQDENLLSKTATGIKKILNAHKDFGVGDLVLKYPRTPANLMARALDYSPVGALRSMYLLAKPWMGKTAPGQREIVEALSRAITGTGIGVLGYLLMAAGVLTGTRERDPELRKFKEEQTGERNYQVNTSALARFGKSTVSGRPSIAELETRPGDTMVSYDWAQPISLMTATGANIARGVKTGEREGLVGGAYDAFSGGAETMMEQPMVQGLQTLFGNQYGKDKISGLAKVLEGVPASFSPSIINQVRQAIDNTARETYDPTPAQRAVNKVIAKLPFVNRVLPKAYKTMGAEGRETFQDGSNTLFNVFLNPGFVSKYKVDPVVELLLQPYESEGRTGQFPKIAPRKLKVSRGWADELELSDSGAGVEINLTGEQVQELQQSLAQKTEEHLRELGDDEFKDSSPADQERALANLVGNAAEAARIEFLEKNKEMLAKQVK
jgi:diguanylate cyclase (GGDEF)-like protein